MKITKKAFLFLIILGVISALCGCSSKSDVNSSDNSEAPEFPVHIQSICRAMTKNFVEDVMGEDYSMLAFNVSDFDLDENEDGTIQILYLPSNAGEAGATKVNLTISKKGTVYTIEYAMLSGLYEVDLTQIPAEHITFID